MISWLSMRVLAGCSDDPEKVEVHERTADTERRPRTGYGPDVCRDGSGRYPEIQDAIDAAAPGDTIWVCPGTYGPIEVLWGEHVAITSTHGRGVTTIDGGDDNAVYVRDGSLALTGFRLTGTGRVEDWATDHGGALTIQEGDVTVRDCLVEGVTGDYALVFDEDFLVMDQVVWRDNDAPILWFLWQGDDAVISHNTVTGGALQSVAVAERLDALHLRNSVFHAITLDTAFTAFELTTTGSGPILLENNVFYDIDDLDPDGGRLFAGDLDFRNNIVQGCEAWDLAPFEASYSVFWDNRIDYGPYVTGTGNLFVDPLLAAPESGGFRLAPGSPAIDAGDPSRFHADADGTRNDIGRYGGE